MAKRKQNKGPGKAAKKRTAIAKRLRHEDERMGLPGGAITEGYIEAKSTVKKVANPKCAGCGPKSVTSQGKSNG